MFKIFIERPLLSTVISVMIVILGVLAYLQLPVTQYPEIAPPTVTVSASYSGANAQVVLNNVVIPLEEAINGVDGMTYMTSIATNDGSASITVYFELGTNTDINAVNVQNRVQSATKLLPAQVLQTGVTVSKRQSSNLMFIALRSDNPDYDLKFLSNYANINIVPTIQRINGVGSVNVFGAQDYAMRIWLKPDVMAIYGLTPDDVTNALAEQNVDATPGKFGENSNQVFQYNIQYTGRLETVGEFENIIVRATSEGSVLRLKDIARIELGTLTYSSAQSTDGKPATVISVSQTAGSNAQTIVKETIATLDAASATFPAGIHYISLLNVNDFLSASINKVVETLLIAYFLVFLVVLLFLQDFRSTIIPAISIIVSLVGTFAFLTLFGFTVNLLTLFALVLAIGIVVDDPIVVVEAVHAKLDEGYTSSKKAAIDTMSNLSRVIIAITLVMAAVFIPISFISGSSGVFFKQFGLTLASAIIISAINSLTLSPALCAILLKPHDATSENKKGFIQRFKTGFNTNFDLLKNRYQDSVKFLSRKRWIVPIVILVATAILVFFMKTTPSGFVPDEDQGTIFVDISLSPGISLEKTTLITKEVIDIVSSIPVIQHTASVTGISIINGSGSNYALMIMRLKPWGERRGQGIKDVIGELFQKTAGIKDAKILFFAPPTVSGFSVSGGFSMQLQDKTGGSLENFEKVSQQFLGELNQRPEIQYAATGFALNYPLYLMEVNVAKVKEAGVTVNAILSAMQGYYGGNYASNFYQFGKQYRVIVQADAPFRSDLQGLNNIYVKNALGTMAPITEFITMTKKFGPQSISRFNLYTSIAINGQPNPGYTSGDALIAIQEVATNTLPQGYGFEYSGLSREENTSGNQTIYIYILCVVFVYFLLVALYESLFIPFAILFTLPVGLMGTYLFAHLLNIDNNIYLQISIIMLIGLLSKNAILVVEYAIERRHSGMSIIEAALSGATARLRPILMTSLAFIVGLMPLVFASGVGAAGNKSIGVGAVGGMLVGTMFGIFVIPGLFIIFQSLEERIIGNKKSEDETSNSELK
ncbi:MAG: efflux RND transporter permease subunit [Candidatus Saccharimonadaceae bacterium]